MTYTFPSSHSPYTTQQPVVYATSGDGGYTYGTPLRRTSSAHAYTSSPGYGYTTLTPSHNTQYLTVPSQHRSKSRHRHTSHGHHGHGHGHGYSTTASYPITYAAPAPAPIYIQSTTPGHHRSHSRHRHPSRSHSQSHHHSHSHGHSNGDYYRGRTPSVGDRVRQFLGMEPSNASYYNSYGNQGRSRHNSFSGYNNNTNPRIYGSTNPRGYDDRHGGEFDHRGRPIHRY